MEPQAPVGAFTRCCLPGLLDVARWRLHFRGTYTLGGGDINPPLPTSPPMQSVWPFALRWCRVTRGRSGAKRHCTFHPVSLLRGRTLTTLFDTGFPTSCSRCYWLLSVPPTIPRPTLRRGLRHFTYLALMRAVALRMHTPALGLFERQLRNLFDCARLITNRDVTHLGPCVRSVGSHPRARWDEPTHGIPNRLAGVRPDV